MTGYKDPYPPDWRNRLVCPGCRIGLNESEKAFICPRCGLETRKAASGVRIDFSPFLHATMTDIVQRVDFAYKLYSKFYAPLALLNMFAVWKASLGRLVRHYGKGLSRARGPILDVAIGDGTLTSLALRRHSLENWLIGLDLSESMLEKAEVVFRDIPYFASVLADVRAVPFAPETFETICCYGGLHVIAHPKEAMGSMARTLRRGGSFHASVLLDPRGKISLYLAKKYVDKGFLSTIFSRAQLLQVVRECGLDIVSHELNGRMLLLSAQKR